MPEVRTPGAFLQHPFCSPLPPSQGARDPSQRSLRTEHTEAWPLARTASRGAPGPDMVCLWVLSPHQEGPPTGTSGPRRWKIGAGLARAPRPPAAGAGPAGGSEPPQGLRPSWSPRARGKAPLPATAPSCARPLLPGCSPRPGRQTVEARPRPARPSAPSKSP